MISLMRKNSLFPIFTLFEDFVEKSSSDEFKQNQVQKTSCNIALDIIENDSQYLIYANLPGVSKENVKITYQKSQLTIEANMHEKVEENDKVLRQERFCGLYYRSINMPDNIDPEKISAKIEDGILKLSILKTNEKKSSIINIE